MKIDLTGKVAIVTGAGEGVGKAAALALAASGAAVCVADLNPDRAETVMEEITTAGGQALAWVADVSNKFQAASIIENTRERFEYLHILINAAGIYKPMPFLTTDEYDWRRIVEVNLTGAFFMTQLASRVMADEGGGAIVNVGSLYGGGRVHGGAAAYAASKAGLISLTQEAARELAAHRVRVNAVLPAEIAPVSDPRNPMGRAGSPDDVAAAALFLCSEAAGFITGQTLTVDGGLSLL
jgi:3-oxoacyl-[acyl-carrier protein] reductase